ncbi:glycosyltransferase [Methylobacterium sp. E-065]|uniref:glycosyltransferase family 2 protein n=1 Tax=Methylobacterium sp. E-065 TaxID=2836583 RepID=UPI001FB9FF34|nr:glycosyltransferase [Methylobacterium sp. E-065]MCJ2017999.1 glycosyltransferase [Methylobacterium sp. E-065]
MTAWDVTADQRAQLLDPDQHLQALSRIAAEALMAGAWETAYAAADRLCRLSLRAGARGFLVRAEVARRLGHAAAARRDIERALELDPTDYLVNLHALGLGEANARLAAARALVDDPKVPAHALRVAVAVLQGEQAQVIERVETTDAHLRGWVSWPSGCPLRATIIGAGSEQSFVLQNDPAHPLASERYHVVAFTRPRPDLGEVELRFHPAAEAVPMNRKTFPARVPPRASGSQPRSRRPDDACDLTVIVPIFEDAEATRICLDSLEAQDLPGRSWRILIVNDASPNPDLVADVERRAMAGRVTLITNPSNLGFAASVNRAASLTTRGDLLLLNADTILPDGGLARLLALAETTPDLGTITPISNNGVIVNFPDLFGPNELPPVCELSRWDQAAGLADPAPIELPNGIGFCLLITRACWRAAGGMPLTYGRGYYEDVDFCLRTRQLGFRHLCATNLIVGHAGSVSFGAEKRRLVVRNAAALAARYPGYSAEIDAVRLANPFREAFAAIEQRIDPPRYDIVILNPLPSRGPELSLWLAHWQAAELRCLFIELDGPASDLRLRIRGDAGGLPQSLAFAPDVARERRDLLGYLRSTRHDRVVVVAPERCPGVLAALATDLDGPLDLLVAGAQSLAPGEELRDESRSTADLWARVDRLLCGDGMTLACGQRALPDPLRHKLVPPPIGPECGDTARPQWPARHVCLGILSPLPSAAVSRLSLALETGARRIGLAVRLLIVGGTLNDLELMAGSAIFVTGPVAHEEVAAVVADFGCAAVLLPYRDRFFGCLERAPCPRRAYFDWSGGAYAARSDDLVLDPAICDTDAAAQILRWLAVASIAP